MRISRFLLPTVVLAGALALAGCGGGDDPMEEEEPMEEPMEEPEPEPEPDPSLALPNNLTLNGLTTSREPLVYTIQPGQALELNPVQNNRGNIRFECPLGGASCVVTVPVDGNANSITYTGGTPVLTEVGDPATAVNTGTTERPSESTDPLSNDVLVKALNPRTGGERTPADRTVWNDSDNAVLGAVTDDTMQHTFTPLSGPTINLWVAGDNNAYYGHWAESTIPVDNPVYGKRGVVWGGSTPYNQKPHDSLGGSDGVATYNTTDGGALVYHSNDGDDWSAGRASAVALTANFDTGRINGTITLGTVGGVVPNEITDNDISLGGPSGTPIGNDGKFSGSASFSDSGVSRDTGHWNGGFFGPTITIGSNPQTRAAPADVAGEFRASRPQIGAGTTLDPMTQNELHIRGAFSGGLDADSLSN